MDQSVGKGWTNIVQAQQRMDQNQKFSKLNSQQKFRYGFERVKQIAKGSSKHEKAKTIQKKHWLEATDPKHRYGNALIVYFQEWQKLETTDEDDTSFWKWIDTPNSSGELLDLPEFPREKMEKYIVKYCDAEERKDYVVEIKDGLFYNKRSQKLIDTDDAISDEDEKGKYIFVISTDKTIYAGPKIRGRFHHSSFLSGGSILGAGNLEIVKGELINIKPHSGHYMPTTTEFIRLITIIQEKGVNMDKVALGTIKIPKKKKDKKQPEHPNLDNKSFEKFKQILTKNFKTQQESEQAVQKLITSLGATLSLDEYFEERSQQGSPKPQNGDFNGFTEQVVIEENENEFSIPEYFLKQDSMPVFFKRGYNESGEMYRARVESFLLLLSRQELVFIISKVDPSRKDMYQFSQLVQQVMKQQLQQQQHSQQQFTSSICQ